MEQEQLHAMLLDPTRRDAGFRRLMSMYGDRIYWHIRRIVVGHDDAEDVLQETCVSILSAIGSLRASDRLLVWIYSIATRESLRHLHRQTRLFQSIDAMGRAGQ
ncbi:MAG: sigma factor [Prevotella sp.]|nr:sigma factor [Prevotella sp.]